MHDWDTRGAAGMPHPRPGVVCSRVLLVSEHVWVRVARRSLAQMRIVQSQLLVPKEDAWAPGMRRRRSSWPSAHSGHLQVPPLAELCLGGKTPPFGCAV